MLSSITDYRDTIVHTWYYGVQRPSGLLRSFAPALSCSQGVFVEEEHT
jgi:hypothetical protein